MHAEGMEAVDPLSAVLLFKELICQRDWELFLCRRMHGQSVPELRSTN